MWIFQFSIPCLCLLFCHCTENPLSQYSSLQKLCCLISKIELKHFAGRSKLYYSLVVFYHRDTFTINSHTICHSNYPLICGLDFVIVIGMFNFYYFVCFCVSQLLFPITFFFHFVANYFQLHLCRSFFICRSCKSNSLRWKLTDFHTAPSPVQWQQNFFKRGM